MLARVTSPHVVRAVDAGVHDDADKTPYLVEEYVDGIDLAELDRRRRHALGVGLPLWFVCHVMHELGNGLRAAHQVGVLHRDMKPSNAFAAPGSGGIRLGDFGLAVARADAPQGDVSGTLRFMAPEQLRGETVGRFTDVYGAGATAYDLRYGNPPFLDTRSALDLDAKPQFPPAHSPAEAYFQNVLARMLAKRPEERPRDIGEPTSHFLALVNALSPMRARVPYVPDTRDTFRLGGVVVTLKEGDIAALRGRRDRIVRERRAADAKRHRRGAPLARRRRDRRGGHARRSPTARDLPRDGGGLARRASRLPRGERVERGVVHRAGDVPRAPPRRRAGSSLDRDAGAGDRPGAGEHRDVRAGDDVDARVAPRARRLAPAAGRDRAAGEAKLGTFREVLEDVLRDGLDAPFGDLGMPVDDAPVYAGRRRPTSTRGHAALQPGANAARSSSIAVPPAPASPR